MEPSQTQPLPRPACAGKRRDLLCCWLLLLVGLFGFNSISAGVDRNHEPISFVQTSGSRRLTDHTQGADAPSISRSHSAVLRVSKVAGGLRILGIEEGQQITLPVNVQATNVTVTLDISGLRAGEDAELILEYDGKIVSRQIVEPGSAVVLPELRAGHYFLSATQPQQDEEPRSADVSFSIHPQLLVPRNDHFVSAATVAVGEIIVASNIGGTAEIGEPDHAGQAASKSVWWKWQAVSESVLSVSTAGSSFDTVLAVYAGTNLEDLKSIAENDDVGTNSFSQVSFTALAGATYYLTVDGARDSLGVHESGHVQLRLLAAAPPTIALVSPTDGLALLVSSPVTPTNINVSATITDSTGIDRVEYWLESNQGIRRLATISPPYPWTLDGLLPGEYLLTVLALNRQGLINLAHAGFSVTSIAPEILAEKAFAAGATGSRFTVVGVKSVNYSLYASGNLAEWSQLIRWTNFTGIQRVIDMDASKLNARFYRAESP